jgi:predicted site-specific integrase-resolvase
MADSAAPLGASDSASLMGPVEVGAKLGVKPQVVVNWIREGRAHPSAVDELGRFRFTESDVEKLRSSLGQRRRRGVGEAASQG